MGFFGQMKLPPVKRGEPYPLFNRVSVETSSHCNRSCSFCPISTGRRPRQVLMPSETFAALLDELSSLDFGGVVQMFLLNEPTLDKRLHSMLGMVREAVPRASTYVSTNADVIRTVDDLLALHDAGCTVVNLNVYDPGEEQFARLEALKHAALLEGVKPTEHKYRHHRPDGRFVALTDMRPERLTSKLVDMFYDRTAEDRRVTLHRHCARPHRHIVVLHDGRVPLCCALDPTAEDLVVVGRFPEQSLVQLWNSPTMHLYRSHLQDARRDLPGCVGCNHVMAYSHVVRRVE